MRLIKGPNLTQGKTIGKRSKEKILWKKKEVEKLGKEKLDKF